jgi:hypothetical protein
VRQTTFLIISTIFLFTSLGCKQKRNQLFNSFISSLANIKLPYTYDSSSPKTHNINNDGIDSLFFESGPTQHDYIGYFKNNDSYVHVLTVHTGDFFQSLCISSFDKEGNLLKRMSPSFDNCMGHIPIEFKSCKETITISLDKKIVCNSIKVISHKGQQDSLIKAVQTFQLLTDGRLVKKITTCNSSLALVPLMC